MDNSKKLFNAAISWQDGEPAPPKLQSAKQFITPKSPKWLIEGMLRRGCSHLLTGKAGVGKTGLALQLSLAVASGKTWLDHPVTQGNVLFLCGEKTTEVRGRFRATLDGLGTCTWTTIR